MRMFLIVLGVVLLGASMASANGLGVYGSYWDTKDADSGFGGGAKLSMSFGQYFAVEARGTYFNDLSKDEGPLNVDLQVIPVEAGLVLNMPLSDAVTPYIGGGGGYYFLKADTDAGSVDIDDEVGWYAIAGLEIKLSDAVALFAEGKYTGVEGTAKNDNVDNIVDKVDIDLSGFGGNAGLLLKW